MNIECSIALDALSIVYMLILLLNLKHRHRRELLNDQYSQTTVMICVFLALDILYLLFYGSADPLSQLALKAVKSLYFIANTAIVWLWVKYIDCIIFGDRYRAQRHRVVYNGVLFVNTAIVVANLFTGMLFQISAEGTFVVGVLVMWIFTAFNYLSIVLATFVLLQNRKRVERKTFLPLLIFPLPPLIAEIVQIFYRPYSLICTYAVSALIVFQISQNHTIYTDELTGLANRRMLNETLRKWFSEPRGSTVCGVMIDLDGLKQINDTYGHVSGDNALLTLAGMIREIRRKDLISARYGGDEFLLIWLSKDGRDIPQVVHRLEAAKARINQAKPEQERIEFSTGQFCCRDSAGLTAEEFLRETDERMYQRKKEKRQKKTR